MQPLSTLRVRAQTGVAILVDRFLSSTRQLEAEEAARAERKRRVAVSNTLVSATCWDFTMRWISRLRVCVVQTPSTRPVHTRSVAGSLANEGP